MNKKIAIRLATAFLAIAALMAPVAVGVYADNEIKIIVNGAELAMDVPPTTINGRTMVPIRAVSEALECMVFWIEPEMRVDICTLYDDEPMFSMFIGNPVVELYEFDNVTGMIRVVHRTIDSPPVIIDDRTLVPLRFIAEILDCGVDWEESTWTVYITHDRSAGLPDGVIYTEEYELPADYGDGLDPLSAAACVYNEYMYNEFVEFFDADPVHIVLIGLDSMNGKERYLFDVFQSTDDYFRYAVGPDESVYELKHPVEQARELLYERFIDAPLHYPADADRHINGARYYGFVYDEGGGVYRHVWADPISGDVEFAM